MSTFEVKVYEVRIEEHPNADAIELAVIGDYRSIVKKGDFKTGDLAVYIPEAAIVPDWAIEKMGLTGRLAGKKRNRVKAIKLRGILSQGLIYPLIGERDPKWPDACTHAVENETDTMGVELGSDVMDFLGITKYEPIIPTSMNGEVFNAFGMTLKFDIENIKRYPDLFDIGEEVTMTEKCHGTWCCFGYHPDHDEPIVTSKGLSEKGLAFKFNEANENNLYVKMFDQMTDDDHVTIIEQFLDSLECDYQEWEAQGNKPFYILGEIFGQGVQDLTYGDIPKQFRVFDIYVGQPGKGSYLDAEIVKYHCDIMGIEMVPLLYQGPFNQAVLMEYTNGDETVSGTNAHMREGVVIRPILERRDDEIGRVILKSVSEKYILRRNATEYN